MLNALNPIVAAVLSIVLITPAPAQAKSDWLHTGQMPVDSEVIRRAQDEDAVRKAARAAEQATAPTAPQAETQTTAQTRLSSQSISGPVLARRVSSTAYCLTGTMANGERAHAGAVAMNGVRFGTRFEVLTGPQAGQVLTVKDRIGHGSQFDVAMPGDCAAARQYGRRSISIRQDFR